MRAVPSTRRLYAHGLAGGAAFLAVIGLAVASYLQVFTPAVMVELHADRAGLLMAKGADVRLRGIQVGEVRSIEPVADGGATLKLAMDPEYVHLVPADAAAEILPATVFGNKNVNLVVADGPVATPIAEGARLRTRHVASEINDIWGGLQSVLTSVKPSKLHAALGAVAGSLDGKGARIGDYVSTLNDYLGELNPQMPALVSDLRAGADVTDLYSKITPDVVDVLENSVKTSRTLTEVEGSLHAFLQDLSGSARKGQRFLRSVERPLVTSMDSLEPTLRLLAKYSPEFTCTFKGLNETRKRFEASEAHQLAGGQLLTGFLPGQRPYRYPENLPKFVTGNGPHCFGLPYVPESAMPLPHYQFDDGTASAWQGDGGMEPGDPPVSLYEQLIGPMPAGGAK